MRHWILSRMIHCPWEKKLVYWLDKKKKKRKQRSSAWRKMSAGYIHVETCGDEWGWDHEAHWIFALCSGHSFSKLPGVLCPAPSPGLHKTPAHTHANHANSRHLLAHIKAGSVTLECTWSPVVQVYDMDVRPCKFVLRALESSPL